MTNAEKDLPPCLIYIDKEGFWYHKGMAMTRRDIIRLFYQNMACLPDGTHVIDWNGQRCYIELEDTAHVVWSVRAGRENETEESGFVLGLSDDSREWLNPETLFIGEANVLYCRVREGKFPARFNRASYYQLAGFIEEDRGKFFLSLNGRKYFIESREARTGGKS
jgi:hypothetical protein